MDIQRAITKLRQFYIRQKRLPSYEELNTLFGYASKNASYYLVQKLIASDIIAKDTKGKLIPKNLFTVAHIGAPYPHTTKTHYLTENTLDLYSFVIHLPQNVFSLTVRGDSMIGEGIFEGDIVVVNCDREPENGNIVAACVDGEWMVKYYFKQGKAIVLRAANDAYLPTYPKKNLDIGGVVMQVIRNYL